MHFSSLLVAALSAASAVVATPPPIKFGLVAIHSGSPVHNAAFSASLRSIFVNLPNQGATCARPNERFATFYLIDGIMYLYGPQPTPRDKVQKIFVDRSGMGQGKIGYVTGEDSGLPRYAETRGWSVTAEERHLQFKGTDLVACPNSIQGSWSIWLGGFQNPGQNKDCIPIVAKVENTRRPNACVYS